MATCACLALFFFVISSSSLFAQQRARRGRSGYRGHSHGGFGHRGHSHGRRFFGGNYRFGGQRNYGRSDAGIRYHHYNIYTPQVWGGYYNHGWGAGYGVYGQVVAPNYYYNTPYYTSPYVAAPSYTYGINPFVNSLPNDPLLDDTLRENDQRWNGPPVVVPKVKTVAPFVVPSSPEATLRSIRTQAMGDEMFRQRDFLKALKYYERSARQASDRAEPHFLQGYTFVAIHRYPQAAKAFKRGLQLDPDWPRTGKPLTELFGDDSKLGVTRLKERVMTWVREDIRDPDRLFVLGILLHFDGDRDNAGELFQTALRLSGGGSHLTAFLEEAPVAPNANQPVNGGKPNAVPPNAVQPQVTPPIPPLPNQAPASNSLPLVPESNQSDDQKPIVDDDTAPTKPVDQQDRPPLPLP